MATEECHLALEATVPSSASAMEIQKFSEWFGALGRLDHRRLKRVGCRLEVFSHNDVSPFQPSTFRLKIVNNTQMPFSWRVMQRCRLSNECFVTISPAKGVIERNATSGIIYVNIVLFHAFTLKHMIYFECAWGNSGATFFLPFGLNVKPGKRDPSLAYWPVKIPAADQLSVLAPRQGGSVLLCSLSGVEVVMKTWVIGSKDPLPSQFQNELASFTTLSHPNLVRFIGAHTEPGEASIVIEYVLNGSLADFLERAEPSVASSMHVRCNIALDVSRALAYLHSKGKVHTSLIGRSILIDEDVHAKLAGFGSIVDSVEEASVTTSTPSSSHPNGSSSHAVPPAHRTKSHNCYQFGLFLLELFSGHPSSSIQDSVGALFATVEKTTVETTDAPQATNLPRSTSSTPPPARSSSPFIHPRDILTHMPFLDPLLVSIYPDYVQIMLKCLDPVPSRRPSIIEVVGELTTICDTPEPRTPTHLNLSTNTSLTDNHLACLPRELESLDLACNNNITVDCAPHLPPTLQILTLPEPKLVSSLAEVQIKNIKPTPVKESESNKLGDRPAPGETELVLPRWISENLTLQGLASINSHQVSRMNILHAPHLTDEHIVLLPKSLTHLSIGESNSITDAGIINLPQNLKSLTLSSCQLSCFAARKLPQTLTALTLPKTTQFISDYPLPPNLTSLTFGESSFFSKMEVLPRGITRLDLGKNSNLRDSDIPNLPPALTWLSVTDNQLLTSESIRQFPRTLLYLRVSGNAKFGYAQAVDSWPPKLHTLELPDNTSIEPGPSLQFLPRDLTSLNLMSNENVGNDGVVQLPKALTSLELSEESFLTETCLIFLPPALLTLNVVTSSTHVKDLPRKLTSLNLERCHTLVDNCLSDLPAGLAFLKLSCSRITDAGISLLPQNLTALHLIDNTYLTDTGIKGLPPKLTKLVIDDGDALTASCLKFLPRCLTDLALPQSLLFDITDDSLRDLPRYITELNMDRNENLTNAGVIRLPRTLTSLNLSSNENLTDSCVKHLPRGLVYLNVAQSDYLSPACLSQLPRCQTIILPQRLVRDIRDQHIANLPRVLLHWDFESNTEVTADSFKNLPPSLTRTSLSPRMIAGLDDSYAPFIPRMLVELDLSLNTALTDQGIRYLPLSLTKLSLYWNTNLTDAAIELLPRVLQYLDLGCSSLLTDACAPHLPRRLLELSIDSNSNFTDAFFDGLPSSLVYLNLAHANKLTHACLRKVPPSLTAWELSSTLLNFIPGFALADLPRNLKQLNLSGNSFVNDSALSSLPPQLTYLNISNAITVTNYAIPFLPPTLRTLILENNSLLEDSCISYMPRGITHLNIASAVKLTSASGKHFPPELAYLDLSGNTLIDNIWIEEVPKSLQHLILSSAHLTAACLPHLPPNLATFEMPAALIVSIGTESATSLPRSLTSLNLWCNTVITNVGLKNLPRVTSLNLAHNTIISDSGVCLFPQHLTSLNLFANTKLTNACIKELPRSLTELNLSSAPLTDDGIKSLPRALKRLYLVKAKVTDACIPDLPSNLVYLSIVGLSKELLRKHLVRLKFVHL